MTKKLGRVADNSLAELNKGQRREGKNMQAEIRWAIWTGSGVACGCSCQAHPNGHIWPTVPEHSKDGKVWT